MRQRPLLGARPRSGARAGLVVVLAVGAGAALFAGATLASCGWDYTVDELVSDVATEAAVDAVPEAYTLPDGRVCSGHDEDGDGVPDNCDNCPNVKNPDQAGGAIGTACLPASPFIAPSSASRLLFDPFRSLSSWKPAGTGAGVFVEGLDGDSFLGGTTADGDLRFVFDKIGAGTSAVVLTTEISLLEDGGTGSAGTLLRVTSDFRFYLCALSLKNGFAVARTPDIVAPATTACTGGPCAPVAFAVPGGDSGPVAAQAPIPAAIVPKAAGETIGLRASITSGAATTGDAASVTHELECRVFNPRDPSTLLTKDPAYALRVVIPVSKLYANGEIGLYTQRARASFASVDVLTGP